MLRKITKKFDIIDKNDVIVIDKSLLRIPYWEHKNIEQIICNHLQRLSEKGA